MTGDQERPSNARVSAGWRTSASGRQAILTLGERVVNKPRADGLTPHWPADLAEVQRAAWNRIMKHADWQAEIVQEIADARDRA